MSTVDRTSTYSAEKINSSTFLVKENDSLYEKPFIYAKLYSNIPVLVLSDTGCDAPREDIKDATFAHLRDYLENCPIRANDNKPINPCGEMQYMIICTHCHFDHVGGICQFLRGEGTQIVASAAGRDFVESDLRGHGLFDAVERPAPAYTVTKWAQAFERLTYSRGDDIRTDLEITILHTPGHTPDQLAWYDHAESHLYVGDSVYEEGEDEMPVIWPNEGSLIEWSFSLQKMLQFVRSQNRRLAAAVGEDDGHGSVVVARRVKLGAGHQTHSADAEEFLERCHDFFRRILRGEIPEKSKNEWRGEENIHWREQDVRSGISFRAPERLMREAREFFEGLYC